MQFFSCFSFQICAYGINVHHVFHGNLHFNCLTVLWVHNFNVHLLNIVHPQNTRARGHRGIMNTFSLRKTACFFAKRRFQTRKTARILDFLSVRRLGVECLQTVTEWTRVWAHGGAEVKQRGTYQRKSLKRMK